ncbi:hypothetical protein [Roseovarius aestuarii]|uniref:hypothetical protein n=1 Tax=Roseovarius aestuarii TaxID=475083 RepID=UPI000A2700C3
MASDRAKQFPQSLNNGRARQILVDAVDGPELTKVLLGRPSNLNSPRIERIMSWYLTGTAAQGE